MALARTASAIPGIEAENLDDLTVVHILDVTDEVKQHIRQHFARWCYGDETVDARPSNYTFGKVSREFLIRYDSKAETTKLGLIGELLVHVVMDGSFSDLQCFSVYFNKEERSIKKGFDLTFFDEPSGQIWYAEVKSGEPNGQTVAVKARELIGTAGYDLATKLSTDLRRTRWDSVLIDVALTLQSPQSLTVKQLLHDHVAAIDQGLGVPWAGILAGVVVHPHSSDRLEHGALADLIESDAIPDGLAQVRMLAIQKSTIAKVVAFLREEADD